jgi:hypothetical protein
MDYLKTSKKRNGEKRSSSYPSSQVSDAEQRLAVQHILIERLPRFG